MSLFSQNSFIEIPSGTQIVNVETKESLCFDTKRFAKVDAVVEEQERLVVQLATDVYQQDPSQSGQRFQIPISSATKHSRSPTVIWHTIWSNYVPKENQQEADAEYQRGNGWRSPEWVWGVIPELAVEYITNKDNLEQAKAYFNASW